MSLTIMSYKPGQVCGLLEATKDRDSINRYFTGRQAWKLLKNPPRYGASNGGCKAAYEAFLVSGRQYRGHRRGQLRYCLGFSECRSQDLQAFLQAWVFSLQHLWWNKVFLRLPCLSSWFCDMKTGEIKAVFSVSPQFYLPTRNLAS